VFVVVVVVAVAFSLISIFMCTRSRKIMFLGGRARQMRIAKSLAAVREPTV
jgi:hypothetical protein